MPDLTWIKRFHEHGGEKLTLGSDAHIPENIGAGIDQAIHFAKQSGFQYLSYFEQRCPKYLSIK
jgi:histidinol-phosphatase (PHP family)